MKKFILFSCIFILYLFLSGCHRQLLEDMMYTKARIPVSVDWTICEIDPQNVSIFFFNEDNGELILQHYYENNTKPIQSYVELPIGKYTVLLFNELPDQIQNITISNRADFKEIEATGVKATSAVLPISGELYYRQPDPLASVIVENLHITSDMVYYTNDGTWFGKDTIIDENTEASKALMNLVPLRNLSLFEVNIHVKGLNNARMPALMTLRNVSASYFFKDNKYGMSPVNYQENISNRQYDENSNKDGTISGQLNLFGVLGDPMSVIDQPKESPIMLEINYQLVDKDKTIITREFDITKLITFKKLTNGTVLIELSLEDPEPLPFVIPEGEGYSGFETTVEDWEIIKVPLIL